MAFAEHGLGKSLSDVFARTPRKDGGKGYLEVDINLIVAPAQNPRQAFDPGALAELALSIQQHGILQPIVVIKRDAGFEIVSGERRYRAAKQAGLTKIPIIVREGDDAQHLAELRLIENIQRADLNPIELAQAYQALLDQHGLTHEDLAERIGKERSSISNALRLLALPPQIQAEVTAGTLSNGHAKALLSASDPAWQLQLARRAIEDGLSVREVERLAKAGPGSPVPEAKPKPPHIKELEANLFRLFGTRVKVKEKNGKGSLTLSFTGKEHFQRVVTILDKVVKQSNQL
jgi:ParB family chromosome partitioning protein